MMNAIILSAGLGTRLKPITDYIPKPLLPIIYRPIIEITIERLSKARVKTIGINLFHKARMMKNHLKKYSDDIRIVVENKLHGTGGAFLNFKKLLEHDVLLHNCDVLSNFDFSRIIEYHEKNNALATLVLTKNAGTNFFNIDRNNRITDYVRTDTVSYYTYTGIAVLSKKISAFFPEVDVFSIIDIYERLINEHQLIMGFPATGFWREIGRPHSYWNVHKEILHRTVVFDEITVSSSIAVHPSSSVITKNLEGFVSIGPDCSISEKVRLKNTIVFDHSTVRDGEYENCLLSDKFCIKINETERSQKRL
jgi:mannose-1-phosphate guanylyltransferase